MSKVMVSKKTSKKLQNGLKKQRMQDILKQLKHGKLWNFGNTKRRKLRYYK